MMRLRGHFDGRHVVLDQPVPSELKANTAVEVLVADAREQALRERSRACCSIVSDRERSLSCAALWQHFF